MDVSEVCRGTGYDRQCQCPCTRRQLGAQSPMKAMFTSGQRGGELARRTQPELRPRLTFVPQPCTTTGWKHTNDFMTRNTNDQSCISKQCCYNDMLNANDRYVISGREASWIRLWNIVVVALVLISLPSICSGKVIVGESVAADDSPHRLESAARRRGGLDEVGYMSRFGYLPQSDRETEAYRTEEELIRAIEKFQRFANLPMTGRLDDETRAMMLKPRCGRPDYEAEDDHQSTRNKRYVIGPSKWDKNDLTYRILNYTPDLSQYEIDDSVDRAFWVWGEVTNLYFRRVYHGHADMMIQFARGYHADGYPFDGEGQILAHAFFPGEDDGGDIHFDDDEFFTYNSYDGTNLFIVAAHEIGHAIGLSHSSVMGALMFPWYQGFQPDFQLHTDDIAAIQYLYGYRHHEPRTTTTTTTSPAVVTPERPRPTSPPTVPTTPRRDGPPDPCVDHIDAISVIRNEVFIFKDKWFWRLDESGPMQGYPAEIHRFWTELPEHVEKIDAVYQSTEADGRIRFFVGNQVYIFEGTSLMHVFPLTRLGFPDDITHVDAAFVWGYNKRTYFITGNMYWRFSELDERLEEGYPRDMSMWGGVPTPVDGAMQHMNEQTYFFHRHEFWQFNDNRMYVHPNSKYGNTRNPVGETWLGCRPSHHTAGNQPPSGSGGHRAIVSAALMGALVVLALL